MSDAPRAASVLAVETAQVFAASRTSLEALAAREATIGRALGSFCHHRMVSNLMRLSTILSAVEPAKRAELIARFNTQTFEAGDVLVREGEEAGCLFLIASGGVEVRGSEEDGDRVVLAHLGPGDVVGEISLVLRRPATADVVAVHTTVALGLTVISFRKRSGSTRACSRSSTRSPHVARKRHAVWSLSKRSTFPTSCCFELAIALSSCAFAEPVNDGTAACNTPQRTRV